MRLAKEELMLNLKELALMLEAGFSLAAAIDHLESKKKEFKLFFEKLKANLKAGKPLSEVLQTYDNFGSLELALIKIGEENSRLDKALFDLIAFKEKEALIKANLQKALRYPLLVFFSLIFAFIFVILFVMPKFEAIFTNLGAKLPQITIILMQLEDFLSTNLYFILGGFLGILLAFFLVFKSSRLFRLLIDRMLLFIPLLGKLISFSEKYYFFSTLGLLLNSGLKLGKSIGLATATAKNSFVKKRFLHIPPTIKKGDNLEFSLQKTMFFEPFALHMVKMGLTTHKLGSLCLQTANYYEHKEGVLREKLLASLQPIITFFVAALVLLLALGVFLPMWQLGSVM